MPILRVGVAGLLAQDLVENRGVHCDWRANTVLSQIKLANAVKCLTLSWMGCCFPCHTVYARPLNGLEGVFVG